jgi:methionyl-tRNA formyltransferase
LRILFLGAVDFSLHCLEEVIKAKGQVVAVLTLAKGDAAFHSDHADLSGLAGEKGIPVHYIGNINEDSTLELIKSHAPDVIFVFGWSQIISKSVLDIPAMGCIGTHPALLPRNRGRHPIIWALVEGLEKSGLTFFYLDEGADSGDILWQRPFPITVEDDAGSVYLKIKSLASDAIAEFLPSLQHGTAPRLEQDRSQATYWRKRGKRDGEIAWADPTMKTYNLVRALTTPYVGSHTYVDGKTLKIWRAALPHEELPKSAAGLAPGTVFAATDSGFDVRTADGFLTVNEYEHEDGAVIKAGVSLGAAQ